MTEYCPDCGEELCLQEAKRGGEIYVCSEYPECRYTKKPQKNDGFDDDWSRREKEIT